MTVVSDEDYAIAEARRRRRHPFLRLLWCVCFGHTPRRAWPSRMRYSTWWVCDRCR